MAVALVLVTDHLYPAKVLKGGPPPGSQFPSFDDMITDADGFTGVFPDLKLSSASRVLVIFVPWQVMDKRHAMPSCMLI